MMPHHDPSSYPTNNSLMFSHFSPNVSAHPQWCLMNHHKRPLTHSLVPQTLSCIAHPVIPNPNTALGPPIMLFPLLLCSYLYTTHQFTKFHPYCTDGNPTVLKPMVRLHITHIHTLKHHSFCKERSVCPAYYPYRC